MNSSQPTPTPTPTAIERSPRPFILTVVCIFGIVGAIASLVRVFFGPPSVFGSWYLPILSVNAVVMLVAMIGVWQMSRWGVYTYIALCVIGQVEFQMVTGVVVWKAVLLRCVVIAIFLAYFKRMR